MMDKKPLKDGGRLSVNPIVLCGGGTGGHVFPALAVLEALNQGRQGCVDQRAEISMADGVHVLTDGRCAPYVRANMGSDGWDELPMKAPRYTVRLFVSFLWSFCQSLKKCHDLYGRIKPKAVVVFGGYVSLPAGLMAFLRGIPLFVHEQNAYLGRTNRFLGFFARKIFLTFDGTGGVPKAVQGRLVVTGIPVRSAFDREGRAAYAPPKPQDPFHLTILGGSQGARVFAAVVPDAIAALDEDRRRRLVICHQVPLDDLAVVQGRYDALGVRHDCAPFFDDVADRLKQSHLVIARSGASTLGELMAVGVPAILVPYPWAMDDHQRLNGEKVVDAGGAVMISEKKLTASCLKDLFYPMMRDGAVLQQLSDNLAAFAMDRARHRFVTALDNALSPGGADRHHLKVPPKEG